MDIRPKSLQIDVEQYITRSQTYHNNVFRHQLFNFSFQGSVKLKRIATMTYELLSKITDIGFRYYMHL